MALLVAAGCAGGMPVENEDPADRCGNGLDDDRNGRVDDGCPCVAGDTQVCWPGDPTMSVAGACLRGQQHCAGGTWGTCNDAIVPTVESCNEIDDDCNGAVDDVIECGGGDGAMAVEVSGDCVTAVCPPEAPYPVGCMVTMTGNDPKGCIAWGGGDTEVYFQEGDDCSGDSYGTVSATVMCSAAGPGRIDATTCPMDKATKLYVMDAEDCPLL